MGGANVALHSCSRYMYHESFDPNADISPFDIAVLKLKTCIDFSDLGNEFLEPCYDSAQHREGIVMGMGFITSMPTVLTNVLREVSLERERGCSNWDKTGSYTKISTTFVEK